MESLERVAPTSVSSGQTVGHRATPGQLDPHQTLSPYDNTASTHAIVE